MSDANPPQAPKPRCMPCAFALVGCFVAVLLAFGWISVVIQKIFSGAGLDYCCAIEGVRFNYIAAFVLLCGLAIGILFVVSLNVRDYLARRDFERKYGVRLTASRDRLRGGDDGGQPSSFHGSEPGDGD